MKRLNMQGGGNSTYSAPSLDTIEVSIEQGFADSAFTFGEEGLPGSDPGNTDYGTF